MDSAEAFRQRLLRLEHCADYCGAFATDIPADVLALVQDDQLRLYEHLERLAIAARRAASRVATHLRPRGRGPD